MKFEKLQPGMTVYDVGRHKMGNTTLTTVAVRIAGEDMELEAVNKLYLELSQFATAKTARELDLEKECARLRRIERAAKEVVLWDWTQNDADCVADIAALEKALGQEA